MDLNKLMNQALSNFDIYKIFDNKVKIYTYNELTKFKTLDDAFYPFNIIFLLFETSRNFGHWCVICKKGNREKEKIYFFDPYGIFPDQQLKFTKFLFRKYNNMILPYLTILLLKSNKNIEYNEHVLQNINNKSIATCGKWCCWFALLYKNVSIDSFARFFKSRKYTPDEYISMITYYLL